MLKKTITYTDYNGDEVTEDFYFNLTKAELMTIELKAGGLKETIERIAKERDTKKLVEMYEELILASYGEKSQDGKRFVKSKELSEAFKQTEAYSELFIELLTTDKAIEFVRGIVPGDLKSAVDEAQLHS